MTGASADKSGCATNSSASLTQFETYMIKQNLSEKTVQTYMWTAKYYFSHYKTLDKQTLLLYKGFLVENFKTMTANQRLQGMNKYLEYCNREDLKLKSVKVQQRTFLENVISDADYKFFKSSLKKDGLLKWHFVVWFLGATGARISELLEIKAEHVSTGYVDIYGKGGKVRRLYIPKALKQTAMAWLKECGVSSGYIFTNKYGKKLTSRGVSVELKHFAKKYGIRPEVVYPHSFRHRFAKNFLEKFNDIALLADLMGHESIETTRIYLRRTATEQQAIVDKVVTW